MSTTKIHRMLLNSPNIIPWVITLNPFDRVEELAKTKDWNRHMPSQQLFGSFSHNFEESLLLEKAVT